MMSFVSAPKVMLVIAKVQCFQSHWKLFTNMPKGKEGGRSKREGCHGVKFRQSGQGWLWPATSTDQTKCPGMHTSLVGASWQFNSLVSTEADESPVHMCRAYIHMCIVSEKLLKFRKSNLKWMKSSLRCWAGHVCLPPLHLHCQFWFMAFHFVAQCSLEVVI